MLLEPVMSKLWKSGEMQAMTEKVRNRHADPHSLAEEVAQRFFNINDTRGK